MFIQNPHTMLDFKPTNWAFLFLHTTWCCIIVVSLLLSLICATPVSTICILFSLEIVWNKLLMHLCPSFLTMYHHNVETNVN
jgi:hypothetical protein